MKLNWCIDCESINISITWDVCCRNRLGWHASLELHHEAAAGRALLEAGSGGCSQDVCHCFETIFDLIKLTVPFSMFLSIADRLDFILPSSSNYIIKKVCVFQSSCRNNDQRSAHIS